MKVLIFDTETTGLPPTMAAPPEFWPRLVQCGLIFHPGAGDPTELSFIVKPAGFEIPERATAVHGISTERALAEGISLSSALKLFGGYLKQADLVVCHNYAFDSNVMDGEFLRVFGKTFMERWPHFCTKEASTDLLKIPGYYGRYKWPTLDELHRYLFKEGFDGAHDAMNDTRATAKCFFEMRSRGLVPSELCNA